MADSLTGVPGPMALRWLSRFEEHAPERPHSMPRCLHRAVSGAHAEVVRALLVANVHPDGRSPISHQGAENWPLRPLRLAAQRGYTDICQLLLTHGASLEPPPPHEPSPPNAGDEDSGSLLGMAAFKGHAPIAGLVSAALTPPSHLLARVALSRTLSNRMTYPL